MSTLIQFIHLVREMVTYCPVRGYLGKCLFEAIFNSVYRYLCLRMEMERFGKVNCWVLGWVWWLWETPPTVFHVGWPPPTLISPLEEFCLLPNSASFSGLPTLILQQSYWWNCPPFLFSSVWYSNQSPHRQGKCRIPDDVPGLELWLLLHVLGD